MKRLSIAEIEVYRRWAYLGLAIGLGLSLAANLAAARLGDRDPNGIEYGIAGVAPVVVFIMIEVLTRTPWPSQKRWVAVKLAVSLAVTFPAAFVSYVHMFHLALHGEKIGWNTTTAVAAATPLMIDGMLAGCTAALLVLAAAIVTVPLRALTLQAAAEGGTITLLGLPQAVEKPVEKPKSPEKPRRRRTVKQTHVSRGTDGTVTGMTEIDFKKRWRPTEHPVWPAYIAAGRAWTPEQMQKAFSSWSGQEPTLEAARQTLKRWNKVKVSE